MEISCPLCESHKTQRLALTYAKGVSHSESTTVGAGASISPLTILGFVFFPIAIAIGALGFMGLGLFYARTRTTTITGLAAESAPPKRLKWGNVVLMALAYIIGMTIACGYLLREVDHALIVPSAPHAKAQAITLLVVGAIVWLVLLLGGLWLGIKGARYFNDVVWARREAGWQRTFLCKRCGGNFLVPDYDPIGVNVVRSDRMGTGEYLPRAETREQRAAVSAKAQSDHQTLRKKGVRRPGNRWGGR